MLVIGEKINATRKTVAEAIRERDGELIASLAQAQVEAGADVIDVNATSGEADISEKIDDMRWVIGVVQEAVDVPIVVDSDKPELIKAGLEEVNGPTPWINSISAEVSRLERVLSLAKGHEGPIIALCMDDDGIPKDVEGRLKAAKTIITAGEKAGIKPERFYFDPLVMPISTDSNACIMILETLREIKLQFPDSYTVLGLSNVSFGLPLRQVINRTFLVLAMRENLDAVILDPINMETMTELLVAEALLGNDKFCRKFTKHFRTKVNKKKNK